MMEVKNYIALQEIVPRGELEAWKHSLKQIAVRDCPREVSQFIDAISAKMSDFGKYRYDTVKIFGYDLLLTGLKEMKGEPINPWEVYDYLVPRMLAVDHKRWMLRTYQRKGKQGLIDYCKSQVKDTDLERVLSILDVTVFHNERPEFMKMMEKIVASKKIA